MLAAYHQKKKQITLRTTNCSWPSSYIGAFNATMEVGGGISLLNFKIFIRNLDGGVLNANANDFEALYSGGHRITSLKQN